MFSRVLTPVRALLHPLYLRYIRSEKGRRRCLRAYSFSRFEQWLRENPCTLTGAASCENRWALYESLLPALSPEGAIDYLEFGVYRGASLRWWVANNRHPASRFVGFDTFSGLPEDWSPDRPAGHFDAEGRPPEIDDPRCSFRVGLFQASLPGFVRDFRRERQLVVHLDADLYSSTLFTLIWIAPLLRTHDVLIFDEFWDYQNEFRAFLDWQAASGVKCERIAATAGNRQAALRVL